MSADDLFAPDTAQPEPQSGQGYVVCELNSVTIAIPQSDVLAIEHGGELAAPLPGEAVFGWFACPQGPWPVYAMTDALQLTTQLIEPRAFVVFLRSSPWPRGLLVTSVRIVSRASDLRLYPLPAPLCDHAAGIKSVALLENKRFGYVFEPQRLVERLMDDEPLREVRYA